MNTAYCARLLRVNTPLLNSWLRRPHPVKPLTSSQPEKKEGRSVLEKLKSTINPGRMANQAAAETEKNQVFLASTPLSFQTSSSCVILIFLVQLLVTRLYQGVPPCLLLHYYTVLLHQLASCYSEVVTFSTETNADPGTFHQYDLIFQSRSVFICTLLYVCSTFISRGLEE